MAKINNEKIKFEEGVAVHVTLKTEPSEATKYEKDTEWGLKKSFGYFCEDNKIFFATEALHNKLLSYHKGDSLVITFAEKRWTVNSSGSHNSANPGLQTRLDNTEQMMLLRKIAMDIDQIKNHLYGTENKENTQKEYPSDSDISF